MLLDEVGLYIQSKGYGTIATDLFLARLPGDSTEPDKLILVAEYPGGAPAQSFSANIAYEQAAFQVQVRDMADEYQAAKLKADQIAKDLNAVISQTLSSVLYMSIDQLQSPFPLRIDPNDRIYIACNFLARKSRSVA